MKKISNFVHMRHASESGGGGGGGGGGRGPVVIRPNELFGFGMNLWSNTNT